MEKSSVPYRIPLPETAMGPGSWKTAFYICWGVLFIYCSPIVGDRTLDVVLLFARLALVLVGYISVFEPRLSPKFRGRLFVLANVPLAGFFYLYAIAEEQAINRVIGVWFPLLLIGGALLIFLVDWVRLTRRKKTL
jgi:hypothetical protein